MLNEVRLTGNVTPGYQEQPAVREINSKDGDVAGYGCQIEVSTTRGRAFVGITHWDARSPLSQAMIGDEINVKGSLTQESWQKDGVWQRRLAINAENITVPRLFTNPQAA